ncbi:MAG: hypothetical protein ACRDRH_19675 [Pseudonocardia sp.]
MTDPEVLATLDPPDGETCVEVPPPSEHCCWRRMILELITRGQRDGHFHDEYEPV